jgi:hypothetical protein
MLKALRELQTQIKMIINLSKDLEQEVVEDMVQHTPK